MSNLAWIDAIWAARLCSKMWHWVTVLTWDVRDVADSCHRFPITSHSGHQAPGGHMTVVSKRTEAWKRAGPLQYLILVFYQAKMSNDMHLYIMPDWPGQFSNIGLFSPNSTTCTTYTHLPYFQPCSVVSGRLEFESRMVSSLSRLCSSHGMLMFEPRPTCLFP